MIVDDSIWFHTDHVSTPKLFNHPYIREVASVIVLMTTGAHSTDRAALVRVGPVSNKCHHLACMLLPDYGYK